MDDKESLKILSEIRDELKEINSHIALLKEQTTDAMVNEDNKILEAAELESRKSKKEMLATIVVVLFLGLGFLLQRLGYI
ncbi:hypothetical protein RGL37_003451 [Vibrio parahaemolyticus]|nr:hypothetical protein [Vibrio parahaemolyticus]ELA8160849.1 hypothetical protein [Vibrio parahaemolyticus]